MTIGETLEDLLSRFLRCQFNRPHSLRWPFAQDSSKLHRNNSAIGPLTAIPPVHLNVTILPSEEAENMIQLLLSKISISFEKYLSNFDLHPTSLLHVFPPIRILMSYEDH